MSRRRLCVRKSNSSFPPKGETDLSRYERKKKNETLMEAGGGAQKSLSDV